MKNKYFQSKFDYIDLLFKYFDNQIVDEYFKSHIAKYLTVVISGIFEDMIKRGIEDYLNKANTCIEVRNYINTNVSISFRNPDTGNLKALLKKFSVAWFDRVKLIDSKSIEALDSIVNNKNLIAHGANCEITYDNIKEYYKMSKIVIIELDKIFEI